MMESPSSAVNSSKNDPTSCNYQNWQKNNVPTIVPKKPDDGSVPSCSKDSADDPTLSSSSSNAGNNPLIDKDSGGKIYEEKLAKLQRYLPFLNTTIARLELKDDKTKASQLNKMKNLRDILTHSKQKMRIDTLMRCEDVLKKLKDKLKSNNPGPTLNTPPSDAPPQDASSLDGAVPTSSTPDVPSPKPLVSDEPRYFNECPASPTESDLNLQKSAPKAKYIPVERCGGIERDFSKPEQETTLEESRSRLKGLMLKTDMKVTRPCSSTPPPPVQIPGLDMAFPSKGTIYDRLNPESITKSIPETEEWNQNQSKVPREEWRQLEKPSQNRLDNASDWAVSRGSFSTDWPSNRRDHPVERSSGRLDTPIDRFPVRGDTVNDWPVDRDIDDRRLNRDVDYRSIMRDVDERPPPRNEAHSMHVQPAQDNPPIGLSSMGHSALSRPSLLPRHMPSHNMEFTQSSTSLQKFQRPTESFHVESNVTHQAGHKSFLSSSSQSNFQMQHMPSEHQENSIGHSRFLAHRRDVYDVVNHPSPCTPNQSLSGPSVHIDERRSGPSSVHSTPHGNSSMQAEPIKTSARERISQGIHEMKKLGVSQGGALRKLKDSLGNEDPRQRSGDVVPRIDPRLEREQRRSLDEETQRLRVAPPIQNMPSGPSVLPSKLPGFPGHTISFSSSVSGSAQWSQSHISAPVGRAVYQGQPSMVNTYQWQSSVKQTTAHDLGLRYQPRPRHGRVTHSLPNDRLQLTNALRLNELESQRRELEVTHLTGRRQVDPRLLSVKAAEEKRSSDPMRKLKDTEDGDISSPLNSLYNDDKKVITGQGYGLQNYRIPRRPKEVSPPKESGQSSKQNLADPRHSINRDPRLSKNVNKPPSPEPIRELVATSDNSASNQLPVREVASPLDDKSGQVSSVDEVVEPSISSSHHRGRSCSPSVERPKSCSGFNDDSPTHHSTRGRSESTSSTQSIQNLPHSKSETEIRSPSPTYQVNSRDSSPSAHKRKSRGRSRSRSVERKSHHTRSKSRGRSRSRSKSSIRNSSRSRGRSRHRSKSWSRGRSRSKSRGCSRGRSRSTSRGRARDRSWSHSPCKSSERSASRTRRRSTSRTRSRGRSISRSRGKSSGRSPSRTRGRPRGQSPSRSRARSRGRSRTSSRSRARDSSSSRSRYRLKSRERAYRSPSHSRDKSKTRTRRSRSRSLSYSWESPSRSEGKSDERGLRKSRARSQSTDSDKQSALERLKRRESPSPDRKYSSRRKSREQSASPENNLLRDSLSLKSSAQSRGRSRVLPGVRDWSKHEAELRIKSPLTEICEGLKKSAASSRSSSASGRSSPLFSLRSHSRSPSREMNFDNLLDSNSTSEAEVIGSSYRLNQSAGKFSKAAETKLRKDIVVSSSRSKLTSSGDVAVAIPTSTSENLPESAGKSDVGSSSEVFSCKAQSSKQEGTAIEPGNLIVGLIKSLASQDMFKNTSLIELAELAASQLPADKRNQVLEIFKGQGQNKSQKNDEREKNEIVTSNEPNVYSKEPTVASNEPIVCSEKPIVTSNVKGGKNKRPIKKTSKPIQDNSNPDSASKSDISSEGFEKERKRRGKNELEKLQEDIREMFICQDVLAATGQRSCRSRKQNKEICPPPKDRTGSADEKAKLLKSRQDEVKDFSDDSPTKGQVSDSSDCLVTENISSTLRDTTDSDDEMPIKKWRRTNADSSDVVFQKRSQRTNFLESESESDSVAVEEEVQSKSFSVPKFVLHKVPGRNVARRGRKVAPLPRDHGVGKGNVSTPLLHHDFDDEEEEEQPTMEDKDMSQIDTSNIIQVEGSRNKLTRNQLKLLKGPELKEKVKSRCKRALTISKEVSECESDTSRASESFLGMGDQNSFSSQESSPYFKKKRKTISAGQKGVSRQKSLTRKEGKFAENSDDSFENAASKLGSMDSSLICDLDPMLEKSQVKTSASPSTSSEMHEPPFIERVSSGPFKKEKKEHSAEGSLLSKVENHEDHDYNLDRVNDKVSCKFCHFSGKNIVSHYVVTHPSEEVLISRLPKNLADQTKAEATEYEGDIKSIVAKYSSGRRKKPLKCLICNASAPTSLRLYEHVSTHTGEYRYSCTICDFKAPQRYAMKHHRATRHTGISVKQMCNSHVPVAVASMKILLGYLCSECNYFQLHESNIKKHLRTYHSHISSKAIRINVSLDDAVKSENVRGEAVDAMDVEEQSDGDPDNHWSIDKGMSEKVPESLESEPLQKMVEEAMEFESHASRLEVAPNKPSCGENSRSDFKQNTECVPLKIDKPSVSIDMSIFIGSEQLVEDENQLREERRKILEEAGVKILGKLKIRNLIAERLVERLQSEELLKPDPYCDQICSAACSSEENLLSQTSSLLSSSDKMVLSGKTTSKPTPPRLSQKIDAAEKRLTRSTSRTPAVASDSDCLPICNEVPDEVRAPLSASTLHLTLKRMQETIRSPLCSSPENTSSPPLTSSSDMSSYSEFIMTIGSIKVGFVEAHSIDGGQSATFVCATPNCGFSTKQGSVFMNHIDCHSPKPGPAPCSLCDEGSKILRDLRSSFNHLVKYHLKEVSQMEATTCPSTSNYPASAVSMDLSSMRPSHKTPLIRPRKLPGDNLSLPEKTHHPGVIEEGGLPSLVISSVISLSKDHTPDGMPLGSQNSFTLGPSSQLGYTTGEGKNTSARGIVPPLLSVQFSLSFEKVAVYMQEMMRFEKICHLYKCLGKNCSFSTNLKEAFAEHYQKHMLKELQSGANASSKSYEWQKCVYCGDCKDTGENLVNHIFSEHSVLKYQCSGCFYRAASAANVAFHQKKSHNSGVMIFEAGNPQSGLKTPQSRTHLSYPQIQNIQPFKCCQGCGSGVCALMFLSAEDFLAHQQSLHAAESIFYCNDCGLGLDNPSKLVYHYSTYHSYRRYHCLFCSEAFETTEEIGHHMCLNHRDQEMMVAARSCLPNFKNSGTIHLPNGLMIDLINLGKVILDETPTPIVMEDHETDSSNNPVFFDQESSSTSIKYDIAAPFAWAHKRGPGFSSPCGDNYRGDGDMKHISLDPDGKSSEHLSSTVGEKVKDLKPDFKFDSNEKSITDEQSKELGLIGLSGTALYICGYLGCSFKADKSFALKEHLLACDYARDAEGLSCLHCQKAFRNPITLMEHLPKHGVPRYICGFCDDFRTTHPINAFRHVKHKHKTSAVELVSLNPNNDPETALFSVRPKENALKRCKAKSQPLLVNKTNYAPEERHLLPLSAVFTRDVTCTSCQYSTKVRSNMMRHLEQHTLGCEPSSVPVLNPVPCLERNEKMFDTMTNHAISSTIPVRRDSNACKVTDEPKFVPENQRYVCCAPACHQISADDAMLRHHIRMLHPEVLVYKCPHCPESDIDGGKQPIMLEKLGSHLRMHGSQLYSCLSCTYYHYHKHIVERHTSEKHPDQRFIKVVREPQADGPDDVENVVNAESEISGLEGAYECSLCALKGMTRQEGIAHAASVHRINSTYKCGICNFRANVRARFAPHFAKNHPGFEEISLEVIRKTKVEKSSENVLQPVPELPTPPAETSVFDSTPLWIRYSPRVRHLRGILFEENGLKPKELEHCDVDNVEVSPSVRSKRLVNSSISCNTQDGKKKLGNFTCIKCSSKFPIDEEASYREHMQQHFSLDNSRYKCAVCLRNFQSLKNISTHITLAHQKDVSEQDVIDTQSEDYINLVVRRQILDSDLPDAAHFSKTPISFLRLSPDSFPKSGSKGKRKSKKTSSSSSNGKMSSDCSKRMSPRRSGENIVAMSPSKGCNTVKTTYPSAAKGIRPLNERSILKTIPPISLVQFPVAVEPSPSAVSESEQHRNPVEPFIEEIGSEETKGETENLCVDKDTDVDVELDESALEEDIEEVEDDETVNNEKTNENCETLSNLVGKQSPTKISKGVSLGYECKYNDSHGCGFVSKTKVGASYHEKRHWLVKPWKCGYCTYQAVKEPQIRVHSLKTHPDQKFYLIENELPDVPTIIPFHKAKQNKAISGSKCGTLSNENAAADRTVSNASLAELSDLEELFKTVYQLRCGYCRLRETSLSRLLLHWQYTHKDNLVLVDTIKDGRRVVPFKFHEVKLGSRERETMAFRCALCSRQGTINKLIEHYPSRHPGEKLKISELIHDRIRCSLCPREFSSKPALIGHFSTFHPGEQISSVKVKKQEKEQDAFKDVNINMECMYCFEPVKNASDMKDHHLNFHSHIGAKYVEMKGNEVDQHPPTEIDTIKPEDKISKEMECSKANQLHSDQEANTGCSLRDVQTLGYSDGGTNPSPSRPSVIACVRRTSVEDRLPVTELINVHSSSMLGSVAKRSVARKSTAKVRSVARKSTGGMVAHKLSPCVPVNLVSSSSESDNEGSCSSEEPMNVNMISCPMMIEGVRMRVKVATLSKYWNIYPTVLVERMEPK